MTTRRPYHHGDLRNACIKAALGLVRDKGLDGMTLRGVAEQVGVSRSAPYRHFANKRDLLAASATQGFTQLAQDTAAAIAAAGGDPIRELYAGCGAYARFGAENPDLYRLMFNSDFAEEEYPDLSDAGARAFAVLVEGLQRGQQAGRIKQMPAEDQAVAIWSSLHGVVNLYIDSEPTQVLNTAAVADNVRLVLAIILAGVAR